MSAVDSARRPRLTAVILNLDGQALLERMLPTLALEDPDVRVVLLDDGSSDGSDGWVARSFAGIDVVRNPENLGVARSFNRAVELADGSDYLALLNNDLELEPGYLQRLVEVLDAHPEAASVAGKMRSVRDPTRLDGAGDAFLWSSAATRRGWGEVDAGQYDAPCEVFSACGGAAVYRMAAFADVGLFDGDFFAYLEDIDWGFRAQLRGWTARYEPSAVVHHVGGATTSKRSTYFGMLQRRNQLLLVIKDYPARALALHLPKILLHHAGWLVASIRDGVLGSHLRALGQVVAMLPATLRKRREIQGRRRVSLTRLDAVMSPEPYAGDTLGERVRSMAKAAAPLVGRRGG
ncbi:MAG: glycosyl transferase, family 2 [Solirubrobacterales bacterium]|nr:glycosyl transferase, family 2 [Solirubrobacterales bacterium]